MKKSFISRTVRIFFAGLLVFAPPVFFSGCENIFTTSLASALARDPDYSSLSLSELARAASTQGVKNSEAAKEILRQLASVPPEQLTGLSGSEKSAILNTAVNAAYSLDSLLDLVEAVKDSSEGGDAGETIDKAFGMFDHGTNTAALEVLLGDKNTLTDPGVGVDTLVLSSVALMSSVTEEEADSIKTALENKNTDSLDESLKEKADIILGVVDVLENERSGEVRELGDTLGFDLEELIPGFGQSN